MNKIAVSPLLRRALRLDAVMSAAAGIVMALCAAPLQALLQLPATLLLAAGVFCIGYAIVLAGMARRLALPGWTVWTIIVGNALWAAACVLLAVAGWLQPNAYGIAFLLVQGALVAGFAELQWLAVRRGSRSPAVAGCA
jgi:hypothetical protein